MSLLKRIERNIPPPNRQDKSALREWWHAILRNHGRYSCCAIFLVLPSDKETIRYLTDFGIELDLVSGENCLVIALSKDEFRRSGFDTAIKKASVTERISSFLEEMWNAAIREHVSDGYSVHVAQLFEIDLTDFPCLLVFQDIRSPKHVLITLKGMTAEEISEQMRSVFSIIRKAVADKENPVDALAQHRDSEALRKKGKTILTKVGSLAEKTFETAIETWVKVAIK
jgi:hypothetical protein